MNPSAQQPRPNKLQQLLEDPQIWRASDAVRGQDCAQQTRQPLDTGFARLNQELPDGGWPSHGLMELLCPRWGNGEIPLLSPAMAQLSQQGRWLVWVSPPWQPYAPGLVHAGINIEQILIINPRSERDALWAMEECLQSGQCSAVIGWPRKLLPQQLKRLHLAGQKGDSLCVMMRDESCSQQPSPAPLRIQLGPLHNALSLQIVKRRGRWASDWIRLPLPECLPLLETMPADLPATEAPASKSVSALANRPAANTKAPPGSCDSSCLPTAHHGPQVVAPLQLSAHSRPSTQQTVASTTHLPH